MNIVERSPCSAAGAVNLVSWFLQTLAGGEDRLESTRLLLRSSPPLLACLTADVDERVRGVFTLLEIRQRDALRSDMPTKAWKECCHVHQSFPVGV